MTKEQMIKFMEDWPNDTIVRIVVVPYICNITTIQPKPENGYASIICEKLWDVRGK